jgi:hypothetical protein
MKFVRTIAPNANTLTTDEFAALIRVKSSTIRHGLCVRGHYLGLQPIKLPNRRLLWSASAVHNLLKNANPDL